MTLRLTMSESAPLPLSVLELATVGSGQSSAEALAATTEVAQAADRLGYSRLWVAEHHNMPAVASTSPPVLIAHLAARTERIRVGSGGVMLPNHAPLVVAEQFALLEALHPGRIDLGIGRAPGTDQQTALALRRDPAALSAEDFPQHLLDLMGLLGDRAGRAAAWPSASSRPPPPVPPRRSCCSAPAASPRSWPARSGCRSPTPTTSARTRRPPSSSTGTPSARRRSSTGRTRWSPRTCWSPRPTRRRSGWPCPGG